MRWTRQPSTLQLWQQETCHSKGHKHARSRSATFAALRTRSAARTHARRQCMPQRALRTRSRSVQVAARTLSLARANQAPSAKLAMFCVRKGCNVLWGGVRIGTHRTSGARRRHSSKVLCDFMSLTDGVDKQPLYDPDSLNGKQRRGADHTFKIQAAREAKKASKGNATSTNRVLPDHGSACRAWQQLRARTPCYTRQELLRHLPRHLTQRSYRRWQLSHRRLATSLRRAKSLLVRMPCKLPRRVRWRRVSRSLPRANQ